MSSASVDQANESLAPEHPPLGAYLIKGAVIGAVISLIAITAGILALNVEWGSAVGLGVFIAFWGGLGFGVMLAGVFWLSFHYDPDNDAT